jgi:hypothetical protein
MIEMIGIVIPKEMLRLWRTCISKNVQVRFQKQAWSRICYFVLTFLKYQTHSEEIPGVRFDVFYDFVNEFFETYFVGLQYCPSGTVNVCVCECVSVFF